MILCCGLPIIIILSLPFIAGFSPAAAGVLGVITPFICPVMMGGMLLMMFRGNRHNCCVNQKLIQIKRSDELITYTPHDLVLIRNNIKSLIQ
jgi:hypothetical protein